MTAWASSSTTTSACTRAAICCGGHPTGFAVVAIPGNDEMTQHAPGAAVRTRPWLRFVEMDVE